MITLYDYLPSQNAYKIRLLLNQLAVPYQTILISIFEGQGQTEEFLAVSPTGAVPAVRLDDGRTLAESNAILLFLAENTQYLPDNGYQRAKVLQWLFFEGEQVQSTVATLRHWILTGKDRNRAATILREKHKGSLKALKIIDDELSQNSYLGGDSYTVADISVFAYIHLAGDAKLPLTDYSNIERWIGDIRAQPGFIDEVHPYSIDPYSAEELP